MTLRSLAICLSLPFFSFLSPSAQAQTGWAGTFGGTNGGSEGPAVQIQTRADLLQYAADPGPWQLQIAGTVSLLNQEMIVVAGNKTIEGTAEGAGIVGGGLWIQGDDVIVRNLALGDSYSGDWSGGTPDCDALRITAQHVWVDHCRLSAAANSLIDLHSSPANVADLVTISHCHFLNQNRSIVMGISDADTLCRGHLRVSIHDCWFDGRADRGMFQFMPMARFGQVHVWNNFFLEADEACVGAFFESEVVVENNFFRSSRHPHIVRDIGKGSRNPAMSAAGSLYEFVTGDKETYGSPFQPTAAYSYDLAPTLSVPGRVASMSGPQKRTGNQAPEAATDTARFQGRPAIVLVEAILNDSDSEGDPVLLTAILNDPGGNALIQSNRIYYYPLLHIGPDTILYQVTDAQGGLDTGLVLVNPVKVVEPLSLWPDEELRRAVWPNPWSGSGSLEAWLPGGSPGREAAELTDLSGRVLGRFRQTTAGPGHRELSWEGAALPPGLYVLRLDGGFVRLVVE